jgi:hypothetical protein
MHIGLLSGATLQVGKSLIPHGLSFVQVQRSLLRCEERWRPGMIVNLPQNPCSGDVTWKNTNYDDAVTNSEADSCAWDDARVWEVIRLENVSRSVHTLPLFLRRKRSDLVELSLPFSYWYVAVTQS